MEVCGFFGVVVFLEISDRIRKQQTEWLGQEGREKEQKKSHEMLSNPCCFGGREL